MRPSHVILLCLVVVSGCQCGGPEVATPVTLRIRNTSTEPLFVDATDGRMGLHVQHGVGEQWFSFIETPPCACLTCELVCDDSCRCPPGEPQRQVLKVPPGGTFERQWGGEVLVDAVGSCRDTPLGGPACLHAVVPSLDERFRLRFCYAHAAPGVGPTDGSAPVPGVLSRSAMLCTEQDFTVADGVVEVGPRPSQRCALDAECPGEGAVCLDGVCTSLCPAHDYPEVGGAWQVDVAEPQELGVPGFFAISYAGGRRIHEGTGTLMSVHETDGSLTLHLSRPAEPSGAHEASLTATLPPESAVPLLVGERLTVRVVDASNASNPTNRALVLRDAEGVLLLAADPAQAVAVLGEAETAPFTVTPLPSTEGCEDTPCGRRVYFRTGFRAGNTAAALRPGEGTDLVVGGTNWRVLNVSNAEQRGPGCPVGRRMPYVLSHRRAGP